MEQTDKDELNRKVDLLKVKIDERISTFTSKRKDNKYKARNFYVSTTVLAAISTIILGLDFANIEWLTFNDDIAKNIALILSALITIVSAYDSFFDHKSLWVNFTKAKSNLSSLKFELDYYLEGNTNIEKKDIDGFKAKYHEIINEVGKKWSNLRSD